MNSQDLEADHEKQLKRAQNLADGKERGGKRRGQLGDFEDDEFDDEYGTSKNGIKRARVENSTMAQLGRP
jgi:hypothetical protein